MRRSIVGGLLLLASQMAWADSCHLTIVSNDLMQFTQRQLTAPESCAEIEITLTHSGKLPTKVMGHNWVLAKTSDVAAVASAGIAAGFDNNFQRVGDQRIIAATRVVGGGESTTVKFNTSALRSGADYTFFCTSPGHWRSMRGKFVFGDSLGQLTARTGN